MWALLILSAAALFSERQVKHNLSSTAPSAQIVKMAEENDSSTYPFFIRLQHSENGIEYVVEETDNKATFKELRSIIKTTATSHPNLVVVVRGESDVEFEDTHKIMKMCADEGVYNMLFAIEEETLPAPPSSVDQNKVTYTFDEYNGDPKALCIHVAIEKDEQNNICYYTMHNGTPLSADEFKSLMIDQLYLHPGVVFVVHCDEKIESEYAPEFMKICAKAGAQKIVFSEWPVLPKKAIVKIKKNSTPEPANRNVAKVKMAEMPKIEMQHPGFSVTVSLSVNGMTTDYSFESNELPVEILRSLLLNSKNAESWRDFSDIPSHVTASRKASTAETEQRITIQTADKVVPIDQFKTLMTLCATEQILSVSILPEKKSKTEIDKNGGGIPLALSAGEDIPFPIEACICINDDGSIVTNYGMAFDSSDTKLEEFAKQIKLLNAAAASGNTDFFVRLQTNTKSTPSRIMNVLNACEKAGIKTQILL